MRLKNSLSGKIEEFIPIDSDNVRMYVCGPTIYNSPHIGNTRSIVVFDLLYRILKFLYPKVTFVRNITDVDDKIIKKAKELNEPIDVLTTRVMEDFNNDTRMLNILKPTFEPKATEHIKEMIDMIQTLIDKGCAYINKNHVLFSVESDFEYGCLSKRKLQDMIPGKRVNPSPHKRNPLDFVLWKPASDQSVGWDSPWGFGRPGWHIECSAMSHKYLGPKFDIHGGGHDLIFPHHENEIAQTRCHSDSGVMANYWVHNGMLTVDGLKMSKSRGNVFYLKDILQQYPPSVIRYFFYSSHYAKPCNWCAENLQSASNNVKNIKMALQGIEKLEEAITQNPDRLPESETNFVDPEFLEALEYDMNSPLALTRLSEIVKMISKETSENKKLELQYILYQCVKLIGLELGGLEVKSQTLAISEEEIQKLIEERTTAKKNKDYGRADEIRANLQNLGVILEDTPNGTIWKHKG